MESNTESFTRVLVLWLELHSAVSLARSRNCHEPGSGCAPWDSRDAHVREVWSKLTDPNNLLVLEQWLCQSADGQPAEWARQALRVCRERAGRAAPGR